VFHTNDYTYSLNGKQKSIQLNSAELKVNVLGNFDVAAAPIIPAFQQTGKWYEYFSDDSINVSSVNDLINLQPGEYRLYTTKRLNSPKNLLGIEDYFIPGKESTATAYPNPFTDELILRLNSSRPENVVISILDLHGSLLKEIKFFSTGQGLETISWDGRSAKGSVLSPGIYFIKINSGEKTSVIKVIKK
jgi:hypothetical protein